MFIYLQIAWRGFNICASGSEIGFCFLLYSVLLFLVENFRKVEIDLMQLFNYKSNCNLSFGKKNP